MQIGLAGLTFIVFLVLKLVDVIDWSWWWVTSPLWMGFALSVLLFVVTVLATGSLAKTQQKYIDAFERRNRGPRR